MMRQYHRGFISFDDLYLALKMFFLELYDNKRISMHQTDACIRYTDSFYGGALPTEDFLGVVSLTIKGVA